MTKKIKWRLGKLPDPQEVTLLLKEGVLTKDEAREILFSQDNEEERDKKSLQDEIKFLRELVTKLSSSRTEIIRSIEYVEKPYRNYPWYAPYIAYATQTSNAYYAANTTANVLYAASSTSNADNQGVSYSIGINDDSSLGFQKISTF